MPAEPSQLLRIKAQDFACQSSRRLDNVSYFTVIYRGTIYVYDIADKAAAIAYFAGDVAFERWISLNGADYARFAYSSDEDDGGLMVVATGGTAGVSLVNRFGYGLTPEDFGAVGDGATDDQAAITAAIAVLTAAGGGTLNLRDKRKSYRLKSTLLIPANIRIKGDGAKFITQDADAVTFLTRVTGANVELSGVVFEHNKTTASAVMVDVAANVTDLNVSDCDFQCASGNMATGLNMNALGIARVRVDNCRFDACNYGCLVNSTATDFVGLVVRGCTFKGLYADAVEINTPGATDVGARDIAVANNYMNCPNGTDVNSGFGFGAAGASHLTVTGNLFDQCRYHAIHIEDECRHVTISSNVIKGIAVGVPAGVLNCGIFALDGDFISIIGNEVRGAEDDGILLTYSTAPVDVRNFVVEGNTVVGSGLAGIVVGNDVSISGVVKGNVCQGNAGNGLTVKGNGTDLIIEGNVLTGNTGYGLEFFAAARMSAVQVRGNLTYGNTAGKMNLAQQNCITVQSDAHQYQGVIAANNTPFTNSIYLGKAAYGTLTLTCWNGTTNSTTKVYTVSWDGAALTLTTIGTYAVGGVGINAPAMSGNWLRTSAFYASADGTLVNIDCQFNGSIAGK